MSHAYIFFFLLPYIHVIITNGVPLNNNNDMQTHNDFEPHTHDLKSSHHLYYECSRNCVPSQVPSDSQCAYIKDCCIKTLGGMTMNYLSMQYCTFEFKRALGAILLCVMLFYGFWMISSLADEYFAPTMEEMAHVLGISDELAGVTIVAFGNGAPDISTSVNAILEGGDTTKLGLGALLGAALFGPIVISGIIAIVVPGAAVSSVPLCRDCFFLFLAVGCMLIITSDEKVDVQEAIGMIVVYICYVGSVVAREIYEQYQRKKVRDCELDALINLDAHKASYATDEVTIAFRDKFKDIPPDINVMDDSLSSSSSSSSIKVQPMMICDKKESETATSTETTISCCDESEIDNNNKRHKSAAYKWKLKSILWKFIKLPTLIIGILWKITIPLANHDWNDELAILSCVSAPIFIQFVFFRESMTQLINDEIPIVVIVAICGCALASFAFWRIKQKYMKSMQHHLHEERVLINTTALQTHMRLYDATHQDLTKQPVMKMFFLFVAFLSAIAWFQVISNELVNMLNTLGIISNIDLTLLGLTISAWGISLTDLTADVSVSRRGYAKMGIAAAIGGATFNLLIGVGLSTTIKTLSAPNGEDSIPNTVPITASCIAVMIGISIYAVWVGRNNWILTKTFGYFCFSYYAAFMAIIVVLCSYFK